METIIRDLPLSQLILPPADVRRTNLAAHGLLAATAEQRLSGKGWLPEMLRTPIAVHESDENEVLAAE